MKFNVVPKESFHIIGLQIRTSNATPDEMGILWHKFDQEKLGEKISHKIGNELIAVYSDYEGDYTKPYTYTLGYKVSNTDHVPHNMVAMEVPAGNFAHIQVTGGLPDMFFKAWQDIWAQDAELNRAYYVDYEEWFVHEAPENQRVSIYLSQKK